MLFDQAKKTINKHRKDLSRLGVRALAVFGSVARDESSKESDIDVLIDFDPTKGFFVFIDIKNYLENLLDRNVDLVTKSALHPALKRKILKEAKNVF